MVRKAVVVVMLAAACVADDGGTATAPGGSQCSNSNFAIDVPTKDATWTTREPTLSFAGPGGSEPLVWRNETTGASGPAYVDDGTQYDPLFCPEGCIVRRFGGEVPLIAGTNFITVSDASTCNDSITVEYVPYPKDCMALPTVAITMPTTEPSVTVVGGESVEVGGDKTGELETCSWYAGGFEHGTWSCSAGPWQITVAGTYVTRTFTIRVADRCGAQASAAIELVVP
jgi:hypothetical protein